MRLAPEGGPLALHRTTTPSACVRLGVITGGNSFYLLRAGDLCCMYGKTRMHLLMTGLLHGSDGLTPQISKVPQNDLHCHIHCHRGMFIQSPHSW